LNLIKAPFPVLRSFHEALYTTYHIIFACSNSKAGLR
jgi:hypothetical protein